MTTTKKCFGKPVHYSTALAKIIGEGPLSRSEVTKRIWDYIKRHQLQDQQQKQWIHLDENLRHVFNQTNRVHMFELSQLVNKQYITFVD